MVLGIEELQAHFIHNAPVVNAHMVAAFPEHLQEMQRMRRDERVIAAVRAARQADEVVRQPSAIPPLELNAEARGGGMGEPERRGGRAGREEDARRGRGARPSGRVASAQRGEGDRVDVLV